MSLWITLIASSSSDIASRKRERRFLQLKPGLSTLDADLTGLLDEQGDDGGSDSRLKALTTLSSSSMSSSSTKTSISFSTDSDFSTTTGNVALAVLDSCSLVTTMTFAGMKGSEHPESLEVNDP